MKDKLPIIWDMIRNKNEKWQNSTSKTKLATYTMGLDAILLFIGTFLFIIYLDGFSPGTLFLAFIYNTILAWGLFKVNRLAKVLVVLGGLAILLPFILSLILAIIGLVVSPLGNLARTLFELLKGLIALGWEQAPGDIKFFGLLLVIIFIGPFVLNVFASLILFFFGNDFVGEGKAKYKIVAYLLWFFGGVLSAHKFYLEQDKRAVVYFFTCQVFWVGWIIDFFKLRKQVDTYNTNAGLPTNNVIAEAGILGKELVNTVNDTVTKVKDFLK